MSCSCGGTDTPEHRARKRVKMLLGLWWHISVYVVVNGALWAMDLIPDGNPDWAYWTTLGWGVGLIFHIIAYIMETRGIEGRRYQRYLAEERARDAGS